MTISKKTLDEAIIFIRDYWDIANLKDKDTKLNWSYVKCDKLSKSVMNKISSCDFHDIISAYARCNATNETIYKAIELLGIEIK